MHGESDGIDRDWAADQWSEPGWTEAGRDEPDWARELWPDDEPDPGWPADWSGQRAYRARADGPHRPTAPGVAALSGGTPTRARRFVALTVTAVVALGAGAGAVYVYKDVLTGPATAASGASSGPRSPSGRSGVESVTMLGQVVAVGHDDLTVAGGPLQPVRAQVTSATRFTGAVRSLAQVRVGDTVAVQMTESDGVASVVTLQDPASGS